MQCPRCRAQNQEGAPYCYSCGALLSQPGTPPVAPAGPVAEPRTSGLAIASLALGLAGLFCVGLTSLAGLVLGIVALSQIGRSRGRLTGRGLAIAGTVASGVVMLLVAALVFMLMPVFFRARETARGMAQVGTCQANMKIVNTAVQAYFAQNNQWPDEVSDMVLGGTAPANLTSGQLPQEPVCPFDNLEKPHPYRLVAVHEEPADTTTPVLGYVVDWHGHFTDENWQSPSATHEP